MCRLRCGLMAGAVLLLGSLAGAVEPAACFPTCRSGFHCVDGACAADAATAASVCVPACRLGFNCMRNTCVSDGAPVPAASAVPAPPAAAGKVRIRAFERAAVKVNGGVVGVTTPQQPLAVSLPLGAAEIVVDYDGGGWDSQEVMVLPEGESQVEFMTTPGWRKARDARVGHWMFGAGAGLGIGGSGYQDQDIEARPEVYGLAGRGLTAGIDVQLLPMLAIPVRPDRGTSVQISLETRLLFHLGSVYTMAFGANFMVGSGGTPTKGSRSYASPSRGLELRASPFGLQFGSRRAHHLEMYGWLGGDALSLRETGVSVRGGNRVVSNDETTTLAVRAGGGLRYTFLFLFL